MRDVFLPSTGGDADEDLEDDCEALKGEMDAKEDAVGEMGASSRFDGDVGGDFARDCGGEWRDRDSNALILDCSDGAGIVTRAGCTCPASTMTTTSQNELYAVAGLSRVRRARRWRSQTPGLQIFV